MKASDIKWCPQHGYPLPCYKCGMPLSEVSQKEIYKKGKQAGILEVAEWIERNAVFSHEPTFEHIRIDRSEWDNLEKGVIPKERKHIKFKSGNLN